MKSREENKVTMFNWTTDVTLFVTMIALVYINLDRGETEDLRRQHRAQMKENDKAHINELQEIKNCLLVLEATIKRMRPKISESLR